MKLERGWLDRQIKAVDEEIKHWPQYMKRNAGLNYNSNVNALLTDYEVELLAIIEDLRRGNIK